MTIETSLEIHRWSTLQVPVSQRRDFYATALAETVIPMEVVCETPGPLNAGAVYTQLGPITLLHMEGTKHRSLRRKTELSRSTERSINLVINRASSWRFFQRNRMLLRVGDAVLTDSVLPFELDHDAYDMINLQISEAWLRQWIPSTNLLVGRVIRHDVGWGQALSAFVRGLTPEVVAASPLPGQLFVDQIGGLLAQVAHEMNGASRHPTRADAALRKQVQDAILQRCAEHQLTASSIAQALQVPVAAMHKALGASGLTFGGMLSDARVEHATRMLASPLTARLTAAEIGWRSGFADPSRFARVVRRYTGRTPSELRPSRARDEP